MVNCLLAINSFFMLPKVRLINWALVSHCAGNGYPSLVLWLPITCSPVARHVFTMGPLKWLDRPLKWHG